MKIQIDLILLSNKGKPNFLESLPDFLISKLHMGRGESDDNKKEDTF
jgi:hypothetical protein